MPQRMSSEHEEFLDALHAWIERGKPAYTFAELRGIANGTITYRLNLYGLEAKRAVGLADKRTGALWPELKASGEFEITPAPSAEPDPEPATA